VLADDELDMPEPTANPGVLEVAGVEDVDRGEPSDKLRRASEMISGKGVEELRFRRAAAIGRPRTVRNGRILLPSSHHISSLSRWARGAHFL
jgi:hypothetical protein